MPVAQLKNVKQPRPKKPKPQYDPIFFRKRDIAVGCELLYKGRIEPNTIWRVIKIMSDQGRGKSMRSVHVVRKLNDYITLKNKDGETREMSFAYASYSAIWQMQRAAPSRPALKRVK